MKSPTVFVVDDDEAVRDSIEELASSVGLAVETFEFAQDFLDRYDAEQPGCLVLDLRMANMSGLALQEKLNARGARIPIVFISGHGDITDAVKALRGGAIDFVQKPYRDQQLLESINEALMRDAADRRPENGRSEFDVRLETLSEREREVMEWVLKGESSKSIARILGISHRTVELHRGHILGKLQVHSVAELIRLALSRRET